MIALGGGVRFIAMDRTFPVQLIGDEVYYVSVAANIAHGRGHYSDRLDSHAGWPPAHAFLLSFALDPKRAIVRPVEPAVLRPLVLLEVVLGTLLVALTALLGRALFDVRTGLAAGVIAALYPTLVAYSHYLWSETLFAVLLTGALLGVVVAARRASCFLAGGTGIAFGVAALAREVALPIAGMCAVWWWWTAPPGRRAPALARGALMLGIALLVVLPWTLRNYRLFERFVPVSTVSWLALCEGNTLSGPSWLRPDFAVLSAFRAEYFAIEDEMERVDFARRKALALVRAEQPTWLAKKLVRNLALLFSPDSFVFKKLSRDAYGHVSPITVRWLLATTVLFYALVMIAGVLGIAAAGRSRSLLPCLAFAVVIALHVVSNASSRYRLPLMPLLFAYAGHALLHWRELPRRLAGRRKLAPALILLFFASVCLPYFYADARALWSNGTYVEPARP